MKTYRIEHTRPGADDPCDEWVPAEVAQRLYDVLEYLSDCDSINDYAEGLIGNALAAADGEEI